MSVGADRAEETTSTWIGVLQARAAESPKARAYTFLAEGEEESESLTYAELDSRARALAACLQRLGASRQRALLLYPPGLDFITGFLGCLYAGCVAVPAYPPRSARTLPRLRAIAKDAGPSVVLTTSGLLPGVEALGGRVPELSGARWLATDALDVARLAEEWREPEVDGDTLAFLQYTSGSTALPKGVMVTHGNLLHNEEMIQTAFRQSGRSVIAGWLPLYHDMGLIGNVLQPLYLGAPCVLMSPVAFLQRPLRWLRAISRYRATTSGGPNFAYDLCVKRIPPAERHGLDLSCWEVAFNGAEPVRADTLERFAKAFAPFGFHRKAFYPCYGLAEATLFVSGGRVEEPPVVASFRSADLESDRVAPAASLDPSARNLVGCGTAWAGQEIVIAAIADPETGRQCPPDRVGEIWIAGPSVARGYWGRQEESERTFRARLLDDLGAGPFLRTGDLGFLRDGELFVTGRLKDLIILRGRNLYPQDLELTAERSHPALRPGCGAAFSVELAGEERLVIVFELERRQEGEAGAAAEAVRQAVAEEHEAQVHEVVLVRMGSIPKTSSGKVQRHACRAAYLEGRVEAVERSPLAADEVAESEAGTELDRGLLLSLPPGKRRGALDPWLHAEVAKTLGLPLSRIDPARSLTALGLDSLSAVEIKSRVEETLGAPLSLATLLEGVSLAGLAVEILEQLAETTEEEPSVARLAASSEETGDFPLSYGQWGLWYLHRLAPESLAYHLAGAGRVHGALDSEALARAFAALVERHPALRTTLHETAEGAVQRVHEELAPEIVRVDLASGEDPEARLCAEIWRGFDLERGPLVRLGILRPADGDTLLFLAIHHIVADFGSLAVMARDLGTLYALETGRPAPALAPLDVRYTDFARWQREQLAGPWGERLWDYWRKALAPGGTEAPYLDLPSDRPRPAVQTWAGDGRGFRLDAALAADLQALARRRGATLYVTLLAAFEAVLARYTGQSDLVIGSPTTGRAASALSGLVGYFANPVALRVALPVEASFQAVLDEVRRVVIGAFQHQDFPFALLAERLQPQRDPSRPPLFDVVFTFQKARGAGAELGGFALGEGGTRLALGRVELAALPLRPKGAPYSLDFMIAEVEDGLGALLRFNSGLFDGATVERLAGHYQTLLRGALASPGTPVRDLPLLTAEESRQLLVEWTRPGPDWPQGVLLHEFFAAQARRTPGAIALISGTEGLTYRELDERSDGIARRLLAAGVGPEIRVGVFLRRTPRLLISMLGVLKAGGAYVPLDPAYPRERVDAILSDSGAPVVVTERGLLSVLPMDLQARIVRADEEGPEDLPELEPLFIDPGHLAYLIYTSGSTGRPKGVAIEHRSVSALMHWSRELFRPEELAGVLASTSICFDMSVFELFGTLAWGGTVILAENALALPELPARDEVTLIDTVPSAMAELLRQGALPKSVKTVNLGGEPLRGALARQVLGLGTVERLLNLYGPSEDTTFSTVADVGAEGEPTIGRILANSYGYVLDHNLSLMPVGVPGELYLGGVGISRGYLGRPDLTAERYVPDPFAKVPGERLYKTGDLVRYLPGGELEYLGRLDHQVKVRGFRVELGEIEAALLAHPAVQDAAVLALGEGSERRLVAYVVAAESIELRGYLKEKLPEYMVPSAWVWLEALPLTPNGKVDRRALARIEPGWTADAQRYVAPRTPVEERLAAIWSELLGVERVSVQDDFFDLGGHSLLMTQLASRVREAFGVELTLRRLFEIPTLEGLAGELEELGTAAGSLPLPGLQPVGLAGDRPLSFAQERLWFLHRLEPGSPLYNLPVAVRFSGRLEAAALSSAVGEIVRRHEALRTAFFEVAGWPVQRTALWAPFDLPLADLSTLPEEAREPAAQTLAREEARTSFDLSSGLLLRGLLVRLREDEHVLALSFHHIASDGWSIGVFLRELSALYGAAVEGQPSPLPDLAVQYADFATRQREWLRGEVLETQLAYWRGALAGLPPVLDLPADRPRPALRGSRGACLPVAFTGPLADTVRSMAQREGVTPFMVLLAGFQAVLSRLSGQEDLAVGSPVANRQWIETEPLIGFFVNMLVLRGDLTGDPSFRELLRRTRQVALGAYTHQDVPFERLVEELSPPRDPSRTPLFQVSLALLNAPPVVLALPGLAAELVENDAGVSRFDLTLLLRDTVDGFVGPLEYAVDLFDRATAERLVGHFETLLTLALANPDQGISELSLLGEGDARHVLAEWARDRVVAGPRGIQAERKAGYVAPRTPVEERLAKVWGEVLGVSRVGVQDDFFDLGGHSLLAAQLVSRVREAFGVDLPLLRMFEVTTVEGLAAEIETLLRGHERAGVPPLVHSPEGGEYPLSFAQERLWVLDRLEPGSSLYNIPAATRFVGPLDVTAFVSSLGEVVRRHQALRTVFSEVAGRPVQRIASWTPFALPVVDLSALPAESREAATERLIHEEARKPFELSAGRLVRALLLRLGEEEHALALTFHHIAADGWSTGVFLRELSALYRAFMAGRPSPLPEPAIQYADFAVWQREWLRGELLEEQLAYWRGALAGLPPALDLPLDRPRPAVRGSRGSYLPVSLTGGLAESIRALARREGATPFMVLLAGFQALLSRLSGQTDLAVGSPVANRNRIETEPLIGFFVNMLVLRGELAGNPGFRDLLDRARTVALGAYAHQDVPFEKLVEELVPQRDPSRTPLFQVSLALQNAAEVPVGLPGLRAELLETDAGGSRFDLTLLLRDTADGFPGSIEYAVDLFDRTTVERLLRHFETLLSASLANPDRQVSELPLLTAEESRQLLAEWTRPGPDWPQDVLLHELFEAQARRTPGAVALIAGTKRSTYRELDEQAERMARRLMAAGVGPEVPVGIFLQRTPRLLISMIGVLKAGGAYVPLDPAYPRERVDAILADSGAPVVITEGVLLPALPVHLGADIVRADEDGPTDLSELAPVWPDNLAYVIYTSGSTGQPKGVAIEHRSASALMHWSRELFRPEELAGVLASTSICFDMSVFELFGTLACGGTVILAENALALPELPARDEVTLIDTVPSAMAELVRQGAVPKSVKTVNLGGEPLRGALARQVLGLGTVERLLNLYGPSEDTTFSTVSEVGAEGEPTIGRILANSYGYVLDHNLGLLPVGVPGELYLGGVGISRGYLGRPDLTAERYVPNPFARVVPGERLYQTGDRVRYLPNGELEYLGRLDHQVKVRGFRVELGEIEASLLAYPGVQDAAVLAVGEGGERRLVAFVVAPEDSALRGWLKEKLPEYMVPSDWVWLEALPLTPNGKVDRQALARIQPDRTADTESYVAPRTSVEERLAAIWSEVLGVERVGVQDDFFDLGGHSLLATQLVSRVRESFGYELPLRRLFEVSTVEGLALEIQETEADPGLALGRVERTGDLPLSFAQERLWFLDQLAPGSAAYNLPVAVRLSGPLRVTALEAGLERIVERHEALRTRFESRAGQPVQVIETGMPPLARVDFQDLPPELSEAEALAFCGREAARPFDLSRGPLVRPYLLCLEPEEWICLVVMHHIVTDGWSLGVFVRELATAYAALSQGDEPELPELPVQYGDFAVWQRQWLQGETLRSELAWWRDRLAGTPPVLELPLDRPRPAVQSFRGARERMEIPAALCRDLERLARTSDATVYMVLLAAFAALLGRLSGQEDVVVGSPVAGRTRGETERLIGFFVNTLALRVDLSADPSFDTLLSRVRERVLSALTHQDLPFEKLVEELAPERSLAHSQVFQVLLAVQTVPVEASLPGLELRRLDVDSGISKLDLSLDLVQEADGGFSGWLEYNRDLFESTTVQRLAGQLGRVLAAVAGQPGLKLSELPLSSPAERQRLLADWSRTPGQYRTAGTVHGLFAEQALKTPHKAAVVSRRETLTFRDLDALSSRLALRIKEVVSDRKPSVSPE